MIAPACPLNRGLKAVCTSTNLTICLLLLPNAFRIFSLHPIYVLIFLIYRKQVFFLYVMYVSLSLIFQGCPFPFFNGFFTTVTSVSVRWIHTINCHTYVRRLFNFLWCTCEQGCEMMRLTHFSSCLHLGPTSPLLGLNSQMTRAIFYTRSWIEATGQACLGTFQIQDPIYFCRP